MDARSIRRITAGVMLGPRGGASLALPRAVRTSASARSTWFAARPGDFGCFCSEDGFFSSEDGFESGHLGSCCARSRCHSDLGAERPEKPPSK